MSEHAFFEFIGLAKKNRLVPARCRIPGDLAEVERRCQKSLQTDKTNQKGSVKMLALDHAEIVRAYLEQQALPQSSGLHFSARPRFACVNGHTTDRAQNRSDLILLLR
jgi:hypothetical protein